MEQSVQDIFQLFPNTLCRVGYGQTENISSMSVHFDKQRFDKDPSIAQCVGHPEPLNSVRLVNEQGNAVADGEVGELWGWSPAMFEGYLRQESENTQGWFATGDLFRKRADGEYEFVGRTKDMIKTGGENVYAQEIEQILERHPSVKEAAVMKTSDVKLGEAIAAAIVIKDDAQLSPEELISFFRQQAASYKKPRELIFLPELPRTSTGKVDKRSLERQFSNKNNPAIWRIS